MELGYRFPQRPVAVCQFEARFPHRELSLYHVSCCTNGLLCIYRPFCWASMNARNCWSSTADSDRLPQRPTPLLHFRVSSMPTGLASISPAAGAGANAASGIIWLNISRNPLISTRERICWLTGAAFLLLLIIVCFSAAADDADSNRIEN